MKLDEKGNHELNVEQSLKTEISELKETLKAKEREIKDIKTHFNDLQIENEQLRQVQNAIFL